MFSLLTGYIDPPAGVEIREGMNYNPYFPGGAISMARVLWDNLVEYEDGTFLFRKLGWPCIEDRYRHPRHNLSDGQRCCHILKLGSRARARRAEENGYQSCYPLLCAIRCFHRGEAVQVDRNQEQENL